MGRSNEVTRMRSLSQANEIRLARAELKKQIARHELTAAHVLATMPPAATSWPIGQLLAAQPRWGSTRAADLLAAHHIGALRAARQLTERQRRVLATALTARCTRSGQTRTRKR
jgi:hypothetical protein